MQDKVNQFERNNVWKVIPKPKRQLVISTKWLFWTKMNESGVVVSNKARLIAQEYNQENELNLMKLLHLFASVIGLESIRMLLAFACYKDFIFYQMDVKSAFVNGYIVEEVYVKQPPSFENEKFSNYVNKLSKFLYGLNASRPDILLMCAYVQDFNHVLRNLIYLQLKEFFVI